MKWITLSNSANVKTILALDNILSWKKKDLTTEVFCLSNFRAYIADQISLVAIKCTWNTCGPKHNNLSFALIKHADIELKPFLQFFFKCK